MNAPCRAFAIGIAAALMVTSAWPADLAQDSLGRLFMSTQQRETLERQRQFGAPPARAGSAADVTSLNGIVTRSSGASTLWINRQPVIVDQGPVAARGASSRAATSKILN